MEEKVDNIDEIILFGPRTGKSLKKLYPELSEEKEFKAISDKDLLFAWYVGSKSSPIDENLTQTIRYSTAAAIVFKEDLEKRKMYSSFEIHDSVKEAIKKMETYSPEARWLAKRGVQTIMKNYLKLIEVDVENDFKYYDKDGHEQIDYTARNQYVNSTKTITEAFPVLIKQIEEGFGITEKKGEEVTKKAIDTFHEHKKESK